jgi:hypothetical protein
MFTKPGVLLRIEGGCVLALSILWCGEINANWILFVALLLVPDLAMLGYLRSVRIGTLLYNLVHTLAGPLVLIGYATLERAPWFPTQAESSAATASRSGRFPAGIAECG